MEENKSIIDQYEEGIEKEDTEEIISVDELEGIKIHYSINTEEYDKGFKLFQKNFVFPKNIALTVFFAIIIGLFIEQMFHKGANIAVNLTCIGIAVAIVIVNWYKIHSAHKNLINSLKDIEDDNYTTVFCDDKIVISTDLKAGETEADRIVPHELEYDFYRPTVIEEDEVILIYVKGMIFTIPKKYVSEEDMQNIRELLSDKLGSKFKIKTKNN